MMSSIQPPTRVDEPLARAIGTIGLAAGIVNITIGAGIFRLPSSVAALLGTAAPTAYVVCALAMGLIVFCMAQAGKRVSLTGGPYAYVAVAFGPFAGFLSGVLLWLLGTFAVSAVATVFATSVSRLLPAMDNQLGTAGILVSALLFWLVVNIAGVGFGSKVNSVVTAAKLAPLLLIGVGGLFFVQTENLAWTAPAASDVARTSLLLVFAFAGIEVALLPSGEVRDPERTVPRAIALAIIAVVLLYVLLQVVAQGILGSRLAVAGATPLADAATASLGGWAGALLLIGASISTFGNMGGVMLAMPRMIYALARDGFLPRFFGAVHPRTRAPHVAIGVQTAITLTLALTGGFDKLAIFANICALALYFGCALAAWRLRTSTLSAIVPWLACLVILWLLTGVTRSEWVAFAACLLGATALYAITSLWRKPELL